MHSNLNYPYPPMFTVDAGGGLLHQQHAARVEPALVPCWTFPPARDRAKKRCSGGMSSATGTLLVMVLLTVFAALGLGAYQITRLQTELLKLKKEIDRQTESRSIAPQMQVGQQNEAIKQSKSTQAAHLLGTKQDNKMKTLKWDSRSGHAFTDGIVYRDGGLRVNETGLYFVYSRVEFLLNHCQLRASLAHIVYVKRGERPVTLMSDHREGFCHVGSTEVWTAGSNLGSMQQLRKDDWVFVNVSQPTMLSADQQSNYFGLFKLP